MRAPRGPPGGTARPPLGPGTLLLVILLCAIPSIQGMQGGHGEDRSPPHATPAGRGSGGAWPSDRRHAQAFRYPAQDSGSPPWNLLSSLVQFLGFSSSSEWTG